MGRGPGLVGDIFVDGAWLVDLAPLREPALVPQLVAQALGLRSIADQPLLEALLSFVQPKQLLLILDNCEHLSETCAQIAQQVLAHAPELCILATSREPLAIVGETVCTSPPPVAPEPGVTGDRDEVIINASWGLGESLVGGTVTPDTFGLRKSDLAVTSRSIAGKRRITVSVPGGAQEVNVPRFLRSEASLAREQMIEVARLALSLEATIGYPVDIECAYASGHLFLLQCRPITTLE